MILGVFEVASESVLLSELPVNKDDKGEEEKPSPGTEGNCERDQNRHQPGPDKPVPNS